MNASALPLPPTSFLSELFHRQRTLAAFGIALLVLALPVFAITWLDPRLLGNGHSPWAKPVKFFFSVGLFALTSAWFFGYVRPERREAKWLRRSVAAVVVAGSFELFWITFQAANGVDSHFNTGTVLEAVMFGLMGLFALVLTASVLPLAWEIMRRPAEGLTRDFVAAVGIGLFFTWALGTAAGVAMSVYGGHAVGPEGAGLPLFGWNGIGGDLRPAHFLGIHAEQFIPVGAALIGGLAAPVRWRLVIGGSALYLLLFVALLLQAFAGQPLIPA